MQSPFQPQIPISKELTTFWHNLHGSSVGLAIIQAAKEHDGVLVVVAPDTQSVYELESQLRFFRGKEVEQMPLLIFPDRETLPYDTFSPHQDIISERITVINQLSTLKRGIIITALPTIMHRLAPKEFIAQHSLMLEAGQTLDPISLQDALTKNGYRRVNQVFEHGEFAVRGALMDLFPMGSSTPFRIDFITDEVDSIRRFDPETQRSTQKLDSIKLLPAKEFPTTEQAINTFRQNWRDNFDEAARQSSIYQDVSQGIMPAGIEYYLPLFCDKTEHFIQCLPNNSIICLPNEPAVIAEQFFKRTDERYTLRRSDPIRPAITPQQLLVTVPELFAEFKKHRVIQITDKRKNQSINFATQKPPELDIDNRADSPLQPLADFIHQAKHRVLICAESMGRKEILTDMLAKHQLHPASIESWKAFVDSETPLAITVHPITSGLVLHKDHVCLISEVSLFSDHVTQKRRRKTKGLDPDLVIKSLAELNIGDSVIHIDHGIGRYQGLTKLTVNEQQAEFLLVHYAEDTKLYVPVANLHQISRYTGSEEEEAPLHTLGGTKWQKAKEKAAKKVKDAAAQLLELYASREARKAFVYPAPTQEYNRFVNAFPFEETPDQQKAIEEIIKDLTTKKPMDRLVCGDVGFGKTEVAMRAAFLAVQGNKQVAILVPTTLLAQQHQRTFSDRFADWPIHIEAISRLQTDKQSEQCLERLASGKIDIIIGTHKLLQKDIKFKNLGLVIIDEEHRFGVRQKDRLKQLRAEVDILALTATPIPRTLNMSLGNIRDLSIIASPPARRVAIKTFVQEHSDAVIQEAITREILRGGQVFFLHNEIKTIEQTAQKIAKLIPEARVEIGHGQMSKQSLERVMSNFYHQRFNILVCTTIIENGIDVPTANTMIVNRADKFGLAQLHQIRGRVGRSHHQAYAYFLTPSEKKLTKDAEKRLEAISQLQELGTGFALANHDLEIRGAGELLGEEQSGQIGAIGFELYMSLLKKAVEAIRSGKQTDSLELTFDEQAIDINVNIPALIPELYLDDVHERLVLYKRISNTKTSKELDDLQVEMIDRLGLLPEETKNLFYITELKQQAEKLGIIRLEVGKSGGMIEFSKQPTIDPMYIIRLIQTKPNIYKLQGDTKLQFQKILTEPEQRLKEAQRLIKDLTEHQLKKEGASNEATVPA